MIPAGASSAAGTQGLPTGSFLPRPPCGRSGTRRNGRRDPHRPQMAGRRVGCPYRFSPQAPGNTPLRHCENPSGPYAYRGLPAFASLSMAGSDRRPRPGGSAPASTGPLGGGVTSHFLQVRGGQPKDNHLSNKILARKSSSHPALYFFCRTLIEGTERLSKFRLN